MRSVSISATSQFNRHRRAGDRAYCSAAGSKRAKRAASHLKEDFGTMMNDPIVVWPPGTFNGSCESWGILYDCTYQFPEYQQQGYIVCCLAY